MAKAIIGRHTTVDFPALGLSALKAKVDTGAYTSAIHCSFIEKTADGKVACVFLDTSDAAYTGERYVFPIKREVGVRSSNGFRERRYMITTTLRRNGEEFDVLLTLTDRKDMKFPVLLGRRFLRNKFLVDVSLTR